MQPIDTWSVHWSVCWSVTTVSPAKMAELTEMSFWMWTRVVPNNHVFDGVQIPHTNGQLI